MISYFAVWYHAWYHTLYIWYQPTCFDIINDFICLYYIIHGVIHISQNPNPSCVCCCSLEAADFLLMQQWLSWPWQINGSRWGKWSADQSPLPGRDIKTLRFSRHIWNIFCPVWLLTMSSYQKAQGVMLILQPGRPPLLGKEQFGTVTGVSCVMVL